MGRAPYDLRRPNAHDPDRVTTATIREEDDRAERVVGADGFEPPTYSV